MVYEFSFKSVQNHRSNPLQEIFCSRRSCRRCRRSN